MEIIISAETNTDGDIRSELLLAWCPQSAVVLNLLDPKAKYVCFHFCGNTYQPSITTQMNQQQHVQPYLAQVGKGNPNACPLHSI